MNSKVGPCGHRIVSVGNVGSEARQWSDASPCGECKHNGAYYAVMYAGHFSKKPHFAVTLCGCREYPIQVSPLFDVAKNAVACAEHLAKWNNVTYKGLNYSGQFN